MTTINNISGNDAGVPVYVRDEYMDTAKFLGRFAPETLESLLTSFKRWGCSADNYADTVNDVSGQYALRELDMVCFEIIVHESDG